jgi:chorismate mutase/prephenate dehydratase
LASKPRKTLADLRDDIDAVDAKLLELLSRRARIAQQIGEAKSRGAKRVLDIAREKAVLTAVRDGNPGPLSDEAVEAVFREIISACRASQQPTSVAYMGPAGTFSHAAAVKQFGRTAEFEPVATIGDVFAAVEAGRARYGIVPIENTTEGAVTPTLDALATTPLVIVAELLVKVEHHLLSKGGDARKITRIASHPQPLAQCRRFLADHFPGVEQLPTASTAAAAKLAAEESRTAAIASRLAGELYALRVVRASIQDDPGNVTRFMVIGAEERSKPSGRDRTSLVVSVRDEVGVLERVLRCFAGNKVNLSMIESRPLAGRPWEYRFFIDVTGHAGDAGVARALAQIDRFSISTKVLGSYPIAD